MIHENSVVAAITKEGPAEFSDMRRCFHPARRFRIEISGFLQLSILVFRCKKLNAPWQLPYQICAIFWFMFFPCQLQRFTVVANASAALRDFPLNNRKK